MKAAEALATNKELVFSPLKRWRNGHCNQCDSHCTPGERRFLICVLCDLVGTTRKINEFKAFRGGEPEAKALRAEGDAEIEKVRAMFPRDLLRLLSLEKVEQYVLLRLKSYLGSETFGKVASIVRGAGGEYISAGKASHFRIPASR